MSADKKTPANDTPAKSAEEKAAARKAAASLGGKARAAKLSKEKRKAISDMGVEAVRNMPYATHGSEDRPLRIPFGDGVFIEIPCYVLSDGTRVLTHTGVISGLGMSKGGSSQGVGDRLAGFLSTKAVKPFVSNKLSSGTKKPIKFTLPGGGIALGYDCNLLADLCDTVLAARAAGKLHSQQSHIAQRCEILARGFLRSGITALIDEATGYQNSRERDALAKLLEEYVDQELRKWVKTFPDDYFKGLCRLRNVPFSADMQNPRYFGHLTNEIVYERLPKGVLEELRRINPSECGKRKRKHHQHLTEHHGHPSLKMHLASVIALMKTSTTWAAFSYKLDQVHPRPGDTQMLGISLDDDAA